MHRAVGNEKVRSEDVQAPEVKGIALIREAAGAEGVWAERAIYAKSSDVSFQDAENHVGGAVFSLSFAGIPPSQDAVRARGPFADAESVAGSVADVGETDFRIEEQNAIAAVLIYAFHTQIVREGNPLSVRQRLGGYGSRIGRATEDRNHNLPIRMRRIGVMVQPELENRQGRVGG
ncbi:MAG TPA: hypothetical protein VMF69_13420 [Gemmataceae bacterium]|nr:hypothetical protein [Gemmataceae bacterium]